jgi:hypothetical protein
MKYFYILLQHIIHSPLAGYMKPNKNIQVTCFDYPAHSDKLVCHEKKLKMGTIHVHEQANCAQWSATISYCDASSTLLLPVIYNPQQNVWLRLPTCSKDLACPKRKCGYYNLCPWRSQLCPMKCYYILLQCIIHSPLAGHIKPTTKRSNNLIATAHPLEELGMSQKQRWILQFHVHEQASCARWSTTISYCNAPSTLLLPVI